MGIERYELSDSQWVKIEAIHPRSCQSRTCGVEEAEARMAGQRKARAVND